MVSNTTIHVFLKHNNTPASLSTALTREDIFKAVKAFKSIPTKDGLFVSHIILSNCFKTM